MRVGILNGFKRQFSTSRCLSSVKPQICIVGAGPAGFYAAQHIVKHIPDAQVDIYERLPVPFGLVRFGVAPDHPEVKNVIHTFTKTAEQKNVRFLGNINLGTDVSVKELQNAYHSVLLTYGADENRRLNIPGENLDNVLSARNVVGWYNGTPWDKNLKIDLSGDTAAIIGQGNVAMDVARILLTPIDELKSTDITQYALEQIAASRIKKVHLIGRRGPLQAAFTIKELREMLKLNGLNTSFNRDDFFGIDKLVHSLPRPKKRITELMLNSIDVKKPGATKDFVLNFLRSPVEFLPKAGQSERSQVGCVKLAINILRGEDYTKEVAIATSQIEALDCDLAITSIGYKSVQADNEIPFDQKKGVVINSNYKVVDNFYASGWLATGPTGVILTTMSNAFATADVMMKEINSAIDKLPLKPGFEVIEHALKARNVQMVTWKDWEKIDEYEQQEGKKVGKPREKIVDIQEMLKIAA